MRIAIINKYQGKVYRGAETFATELVKNLSGMHDIEILNAPTIVLKKKYDIIIPVNGRGQAFFIRLISWLKGAKVIISGQSGAGLDDRLNLYSFPDVFVGLTNYQSSWAKKINPFVRVETIPNGVDLSLFSPKKKSTSEKIILSVGAFTRDKRHDLTIKAVSKIPNAKLIIVGGGGDGRSEIEQLGRGLLGTRFETKSVTHDKMPEIYKNADIFAFPTVPWESFGIAMVEAMASGLPVVATDDPIRREIVGDAGLLVDPKDPDSYAQALNKALKKDWGELPRTQAEKFSWTEIAKKYEKIFQSLAHKG